MSLPFNIARLHEQASTIEGYEVIRNSFPAVSNLGFVISYATSVFDSLEEVAEDYMDWPEDQGFGSSDMTYVIKSFIDSMIGRANLRGHYETKFTPRLSVVEYSEAQYHEAQLLKEQGI